MLLIKYVETFSFSSNIRGERRSPPTLIDRELGRYRLRSLGLQSERVQEPLQERDCDETEKNSRKYRRAAYLCKKK
jgi:hypothetical protein